MYELDILYRKNAFPIPHGYHSVSMWPPFPHGCHTGKCFQALRERFVLVSHILLCEKFILILKNLLIHVLIDTLNFSAESILRVKLSEI